MIGIPILDDLSYDDLVRIVTGDLKIRIPLEPPLQTSIEDISEPQLIQFNEMDNNKIITLCSMEIESRDGWAYLADKLKQQKINNVSENSSF